MSARTKSAVRGLYYKCTHPFLHRTASFAPLLDLTSTFGWLLYERCCIWRSFPDLPLASTRSFPRCPLMKYIAILAGQPVSSTRLAHIVFSTVHKIVVGLLTTIWLSWWFRGNLTKLNPLISSRDCWQHSRQSLDNLLRLALDIMGQRQQLGSLNRSEGKADFDYMALNMTLSWTRCPFRPIFLHLAFISLPLFYHFWVLKARKNPLKP